MISKITYKRVGSDTEYVKGLCYNYNLWNRLAAIWDMGTDEIDPADDILLTEYSYSVQGIRTQKIDYESSPNQLTIYLTDPANHTGYAQVLEETAYEDFSGWVPLTQIFYTIGDDVIAQTSSAWDSVDTEWDAGDAQYLLYDGHGSTRQLANSSQVIQQNYNYDAYGTLLQDASAETSPGITPSQDTSLLYAGEQFDTNAQMYYNRARYYNPLNGFFNQVDPYAGNLQDPQSLHKYIYCHNNPINRIDPLGLFTQYFGYAAELEIQGIYSFDHIGDNISLGNRSMLGDSRHRAYKLKPDILNYSRQTWLEIKPFTYNGIIGAKDAFLKYYFAFRPFGYRPEINWIPSTQVLTVCGLPVYFWNAGGVVFYTDYPELGDDLVKITSVAAALAFMKTALGGQVLVGATLRTAPRLAITAKRIDYQRLQRHIGIAAMLAIGFGVL